MILNGTQKSAEGHKYEENREQEAVERSHKWSICWGYNGLCNWNARKELVNIALGCLCYPMKLQSGTCSPAKAEKAAWKALCSCQETGLRLYEHRRYPFRNYIAIDNKRKQNLIMRHTDFQIIEKYLSFLNLPFLCHSSLNLKGTLSVISINAINFFLYIKA